MKSDSYKEIRKKRYLVFRALGYNSKTATALSQRKLDVTGLEISKKTDKLKRNRTTKLYLEDYKDYKTTTTTKRVKGKRVVTKQIPYIDDYQERIQELKGQEKSLKSRNKSVYTFHGMLTHDKRFKGENGRVIQIIKNENNLTTNQAYYFFYFMTQNGLTYQETRKQLLSNKDFEMYDKLKKGR